MSTVRPYFIIEHQRGLRSKHCKSRSTNFKIGSLHAWFQSSGGRWSQTTHTLGAKTVLQQLSPKSNSIGAMYGTCERTRWSSTYAEILAGVYTKMQSCKCDRHHGCSNAAHCMRRWPMFFCAHGQQWQGVWQHALQLENHQSGGKN